FLSEQRAWSGGRDSARLDSCGSDLSGNRRIRICGTLLACTLMMPGCATMQKVLPTAAWHQARVRNEGYSLLYQLLSQESDVGKILIIKHADSPVVDII